MAGGKSKKRPAFSDWSSVAAYASSLPGAEISNHYGKPAVKVNGHTMIGVSRESDSFVLHIDQSIKNILMAAHPTIFWQTPHYDGWDCLLVRFDSDDQDRVREAIERSWQWATELKNPKVRKRR
jgi:hypothetical protein